VIRRAFELHGIPLWLNYFPELNFF